MRARTPRRRRRRRRRRFFSTHLRSNVPLPRRQHGTSQVPDAVRARRRRHYAQRRRAANATAAERDACSVFFEGGARASATLKLE
jgi:hypothetical protein